MITEGSGTKSNKINYIIVRSITYSFTYDKYIRLKEVSGVHRDIPQLKGLWRTTKLAAKKTVSEHQRAIRATGGGQQPPSPSQKVLIIVDLWPTDFIEDENKFDSDGVSLFITEDDIEKVHNSTVLYDMDINVCMEVIYHATSVYCYLYTMYKVL
ncbi:uncharacterized protein LOC126376755 [Pectinophora gossypiella]|uniref:uncharacterized protein LOC126376755 n=1 Tax=Pectinophora gossypiella TaxID=13191 RepID=UPI00214F5B3E|nr:uncharacterized protein LOC126376755 [Pectinophora gossypiella]